MITSQVDRSGPFLVTALPQTIPTGFPFQSGADLLVLNLGATAGANDPATVLILGSDYTVTGGNYNSQNDMQEGSVVVVSTGANNVQVNDLIVIMRNVPINQTASFLQTGPLTLAQIEQALDKLATLSQQVNEIGGRSLQFENFEFLSPTLSLASRKGTVMGFDSNGTPAFYSSATVALGSSTLVQATGSTTPRTLADRFAVPLNIRDYGAVVDSPVGTTDSTAAIQAAITAAINAGGGSVYIPSGTYRITAPLTFTPSAFHKVEFYGDNNLSSIIKADFTSVALRSAINVQNSSGTRTYINFHDFQVVGINDPLTIGIYCEYTGSFSEMQNVFVLKFYDGIRIANDYTVKLFNISCTNNVHNGLTLGLNLAGAINACNNVGIFGGQFGANGNNGVESNFGLNVSLYGAACESNTVHNIYFTGVSGGSINGVYIEYNPALGGHPTSQVYLLNCMGVTIDGMTCSAFDTSGNDVIKIAGSTVTINSLAIDNTLAAAANAVGVDISGGSGVTINGSSIHTCATAIKLTNPCRVTMTMNEFAYYTNVVVTDNSALTILDWWTAQATYISSSTLGASVIKTIRSIDGNFLIGGLAVYANNAAALSGGLIVGQLYRNGDALQIVH